MNKRIQARINGRFVEITWKENGDKKVLLIQPKNIRANYRAAQSRCTECGEPSDTLVCVSCHNTFG